MHFIVITYIPFYNVAEKAKKISMTIEAHFYADFTWIRRALRE